MTGHPQRVAQTVVVLLLVVMALVWCHETDPVQEIATTREAQAIGALVVGQELHEVLFLGLHHRGRHRGQGLDVGDGGHEQGPSAGRLCWLNALRRRRALEVVVRLGRVLMALEATDGV